MLVLDALWRIEVYRVEVGLGSKRFSVAFPVPLN